MSAAAPRPDCASCHESPALDGFEHCADCLRITRVAAASAEHAAQNAERAGHSSQAGFIRSHAPRVWTPVPTPTPTFEERVAASRARTTADPFCRIRR